MTEETKQFKAPTQEEFKAMTPDQQSVVLADAMSEVQKTYQETKLDTEDLLLKKIQSAIESKEFNFYPHAICKAIDAEAERQFQEMLKDIIKGVPPKRLNEIKSTVIKWYNEEEERFETYKHNFMSFARGPADMNIGSTPAFVHADDASAVEGGALSLVKDEETEMEVVSKSSKSVTLKKKPAAKKKK